MAEVSDVWGQVVDFDNHYYEPEDVFSRHIDPAFRDLAITYTETGDGRMWKMGDLICGSYTIPGVPVDRVPAPGFTAGLFDGSIETRFQIDKINPSDLKGKVVILHAGADNYANIPLGALPTQYTENSPEASAATAKTGNAGDRVACGVITSR